MSWTKCRVRQIPTCKVYKGNVSEPLHNSRSPRPVWGYQQAWAWGEGKVGQGISLETAAFLLSPAPVPHSHLELCDADFHGVTWRVLKYVLRSGAMQHTRAWLLEEKTKKCFSNKTKIVREFDLFSQSLQMAMVAKDDHNYYCFLTVLRWRHRDSYMPSLWIQVSSVTILGHSRNNSVPISGPFYLF